MKIVKPGIEIMEQDVSLGLEGALRHIERIGRGCYKSEDRITEDSYKKFVKMLEDKGHGAMLEHGTVYLIVPTYEAQEVLAVIGKYSVSWVNHIRKFHAITTNYRTLYENNLLDLMTKKWVVDGHERRVSVRFVCDRGVSHEFVRNRGKLGNAFAQESTRYCDYNKAEGVAYCLPIWLTDEQRQKFEDACRINECWYEQARVMWGWQPQQARGFLNHFLKTELIITAFMSEEHFLSLRAAPSAHPSAQELAYMVKEEFENRGWL